jgi:hypothetical protein
MDVISLGKNSIRIKGKTASIVIDPNLSIGKTEAQATLSLKNNPDFSDAKVEGSRIAIKGPGEYEVNGLKISCLSTDQGLAARMDVDNVKVIIGSGISIEKIQDKIEACDILVVNADAAFNHSVLTSLEPKVLIVYGDQRLELKKALGEESSEKISKYSTTFEKLPQEMEFILFD